ncbi:MAG: DUF3106 domain-containing protein [Betaproteobacteria bacterium]
MVKARLFGIIFSIILASTGWAATTSPSLIATPPQPKWSELTVTQKIVLAPLSDDWDSLESYRQKKWLSIVTRFPAMAPEEQRRIQGQMQEWGKLTPEQREQARQNYKAAIQLPSEKKQELKQKWEEYSSLPEAEKEKLKEQASSKPAPKPGRPSTPPVPLVAAPAAAVPPIADTAPALSSAAVPPVKH